MGEVTCGWAGCSNSAEASVDGRRLCRNHFYDIAARCLDEHRARLCEGDPVGAHRTRILKFVSELINETTLLVASGKFFGQEQRDQYLELCLSASELYKRVQREPRIARNMPILIGRETDAAGRQELTNTVDVSKQGACIATNGVWKTEEKIWIQRPQNSRRALARVAWVKKGEPSQFLMGLEILDCADFWGLESASVAKKKSRVRVSTPR
jgi:hypothetical protein